MAEVTEKFKQRSHGDTENARRFVLWLRDWVACGAALRAARTRVTAGLQAPECRLGCL